jgi:uncharacterized small protein (DUF1192 family)
MGPWLDSDPSQGWADYADDLARRNGALREEVERLRAELETANNDRAAMLGSLNVLHGRITDLRGEVARLKVDLAELREAAEAEVAVLNARIRAAVRVLLRFAGRLRVSDGDLADMLAAAEVRIEDERCENETS